LLVLFSSPQLRLDIIHLALKLSADCHGISPLTSIAMIALPQFVIWSLATQDPVISFSDHVIRISQTRLYHLRQLCTTGHSPSPQAISTLVHALICNKVDFDYIYAGLSSLNFSKLQSIPSTAAHLINGFLKFAHISVIIRETFR